ncbi:MAG: SpoIIIAC/SpoIIIAD family protein [Acutalibacteraceae bacterium]
MNMLSVFGLALVAAAAALALKKYAPEISALIAVAAGLIILVFVLTKLLPSINTMADLLENTTVPREYLAVLLKAVGISLGVKFTSDTCKDMGQNSIAAKVEFSGRVAILLSALPLFEDVAEIIINLISGAA